MKPTAFPAHLVLVMGLGLCRAPGPVLDSGNEPGIPVVSMAPAYRVTASLTNRHEEFSGPSYNLHGIFQFDRHVLIVEQATKNLLADSLMRASVLEIVGVASQIAGDSLVDPVVLDHMVSGNWRGFPMSIRYSGSASPQAVGSSWQVRTPLTIRVGGTTTGVELVAGTGDLAVNISQSGRLTGGAISTRLVYLIHDAAGEPMRVTESIEAEFTILP